MSYGRTATVARKETMETTETTTGAAGRPLAPERLLAGGTVCMRQKPDGWLAFLSGHDCRGRGRTPAMALIALAIDMDAIFKPEPIEPANAEADARRVEQPKEQR